MSTDIVPVDYDRLYDLAEKIAKSPLLPQAYRGKPADAAIAMLYGAEMGLPPMTSLQRVVVVNGKPTLDAQGITAQIRSAGHSLTGDSTDTEAVVKGKRGDNGDEITVTFTIHDADRAGLLRNDTWKKYPKAMLWARAVSMIGRQLFSDVLMGFSYTPEEAQSFSPPSPPEPAPAETRTTPRKPPAITPPTHAAVPVADEVTGEIEELAGADSHGTSAGTDPAPAAPEPIDATATQHAPMSMVNKLRAHMNREYGLRDEEEVCSKLTIDLGRHVKDFTDLTVTDVERALSVPGSEGNGGSEEAT